MKRSLPLRGESTNTGIKGEANHLDAATCMCNYRLFYWETHVCFTLVRWNQPDVAVSEAHRGSLKGRWGIICYFQKFQVRRQKGGTKASVTLA